MNLMVHGITNPRFKYQDTMSKSFNEFNKYDIVLANPPFKGNIDKGDIWEEANISTTKTELLFIDRIIQLLKPGGRALFQMAYCLVHQRRTKQFAKYWLKNAA